MSHAPNSPAAVLDFWFGVPGSDEFGRSLSRWFRKDPAFDALVRERFGATIAAAIAGALDDWRHTPMPALARVIVLDQFTRNALRDRPEAFSGDALALDGARAIVARGWDALYLPVQRWFCYLPFEHSEDPEDQRVSLELFGRLRDDPQAGGAWLWAQRHHEVIAQFGRFPHRNAILGRESTLDEIAFLARPGAGF